MNSSGGSVRSVSQKRSATQVAEPTASPAKSSASCLDQKGREQRWQLCDVGSPRQSTSKAPSRELSTGPQRRRCWVRGAPYLSSRWIGPVSRDMRAQAWPGGKDTCSRSLISRAQVDHYPMSLTRFDSHTTEAREATKTHAGGAGLRALPARNEGARQAAGLCPSPIGLKVLLSYRGILEDPRR